MTTPATVVSERRAAYLTARDVRVAQELAIVRLLDAAGLNGHEVIDALAMARSVESDAWRDLPHDDRMAVFNEDKARRDQLLADIAARRRERLAGGARS